MQVLPVEAGVREAAALAERLNIAASARNKHGDESSQETLDKLKAATAGRARLEIGQYVSIADALSAAEAGDTIVLGPGHHWEASALGAILCVMLFV